MEASGAAAGTSALLSEVRWTQTRTRQLPPERDVSAEPPRIGVFVCNCGINIGGIVDVPAVREYARTLPNVVHVEDNLFTCSQDTQVRMGEVIKEKGINRMVVAACTPLTHEPLFRETLLEVGLNKYLFEMANIRNQDSWVHMNDRVKATEKAKDLVRMSVARAALLKPLSERMVDITQRALVIGGGVAGLNATLNLARQGFEAVLVEKDKELGGLARKVSHTIEGLEVQPYLDQLIADVRAHEKIQVLTDAKVANFKGYKGNFTTKVQVGAEGKEVEFEHGVAIVATGAVEYQPKEFHYGENKRVMTQLELDRVLHGNGGEAGKWERVVMIQCVGSRNEENPNCSRICCQSAVKHALQLKYSEPGYGHLHSLPGHEDVRAAGRFLHGSPKQGHHLFALRPGADARGDQQRPGSGSHLRGSCAAASGEDSGRRRDPERGDTGRRYRASGHAAQDPAQCLRLFHRSPRQAAAGGFLLGGHLSVRYRPQPEAHQ